MKKFLAILLVVFLLAFGSTTAFADPGGGTHPIGGEGKGGGATTMGDPGGGTHPDGGE